MNNRQFIARQRVKYIWKSLRRTSQFTGVGLRDVGGETREAFWDYEPTPRKV